MQISRAFTQINGKFNHQPTARSANSHRLLVVKAQSPLASASSSDLLDWATSQGIDVSKISPKITSSGLIATRSIAKGETAISIPETSSINKDTVSQSELGPFVDSLDAWLAVALFLIKERSNPSSPWKAYINSLPTQIGSPVSWSTDELSLLDGTQIINTIQGYQSFFSNQYTNLKETLFNPNPSIFPSDLYTYEAFIWAACTVRARTHPHMDGDDVALVPIVDLVQHGRGLSSNILLQRKSTGLFGKDKAIVLEAQRGLQQDEPIAFDFGINKTEGQIFLDYGMIDSKAPGSFALTVTLSDDDRFFDDKIDILEQAGYQESNEFVLTAGTSPPMGFLANLRLVNLQGGDAFLLEALFRNEVWEHLQYPISEGNEGAVYQSMVEGCASALSAYPTTVDDDIAALKNAAPGSKEAAAVTVRMGEKEALETAQRYFENKIGQLNDLEYYGDRRLKRLGLLDKEGKPTDWDSFFEDGIA